MRFWILMLAWSCTLVRADDLRLDDLGSPFVGNKVEIVWALSTNTIPATLNVFRVVPAPFSPDIISNLIAIGEFKNPAAVKKALLPALDGKDCSYEEEPAHKAISLSPAKGLASLFNNRVIPLPGQPETGLPSDAEVLQLTLAIANRLGIQESELAKKGGSKEFLLWRDQRTRSGLLNGQYTKREVARGIYLYRAVNGVSFAGHGLCGGLYVNFGNHGKVAQLDLSWRKLSPLTAKPVASTEELTRKLKAGGAFIQIEDADPSQIRKLTITNMVPHYRGYASNEPQERVLPFVILEAIADTGDRRVPASLLCGIMKD